MLLPMDTPEQNTATTPAPAAAPAVKIPAAGPSVTAPPPAVVSGATAAHTIEKLLLQKGLITQQQLDELGLEHINTGLSYEALIQQKGLVDSIAFNQARAEVLGMEFVQVTKMDIPSFILDFIPESLATKYHVLPFSEEGATLHVAMADPLDLQVIAIIEKKSGMRVKPYLADTDEVTSAVQQQYSKALGTEVSQAIKEVNERMGRDGTTRLDPLETADLSMRTLQNAPVARIVGNILQYAVRSRASDVHIEPSEDKTRVRYRIDGVMQERLSLPRNIHDNLSSRIKILSNLKIDEKRLPQDGRFKVEVGNAIVDMRVSTLPTVYGEKIVMRLLEGTGVVIGVQELGLRGEALKRFEGSLSKTVGIILVTGPTGSGKTNTLAAALARVNTPKVNIVTLEDPVEIRIQGINQVQINHTAGLTFSSGLRSILRQDPDILMVGEIRDFETAELAIHAALTGHLVFSTLHTKSAAGALPRLYDMKVEPFLLASTVDLIVAQRLVRTLCTHCKEEYAPSEAEVADIQTVLGPLLQKEAGAIKLYKPVGCEECDGTGYVGRTGIFEVLKASQRISQAVVARKPEDDIQKIAVEEGMITLLQDGYLKATNGDTTLEEVLRVAKD